ncbi:M14 family metallopeptidase [Halegenticoccus tardaugens]|uniref:M14 family metallopeptidase n=1 Tax=Halegenticoccus tardaugens TaxID=2071624 RepID=UPI00100A9EE1|nr:M14 family metallopeptidase [Halegenticoccus tardaugens]
MEAPDSPTADGIGERDDATRRDFLRISAGIGGAVATAALASRETLAREESGERLTDLYEFIYRHTPGDRTIPTLLRVEDESAFDALSDVSGTVRTTTDPRPAAFAELLPEEFEELYENAPELTAFRYSPGSNPFWLLGDYDDGVFLPTTESVDYIDYEELLAGMGHLAEENGDELRFYSVGESPGWYNVYEDRSDPKPIYVAELTNDVGDETAFAEKEKVLFSLSIHGDERSGVETGARVIERTLAGDRPELASRLDDVALLFLFPNPDGWVAKSPEYYSGSEATDEDLVRIDAHRRPTANEYDMNRQWPTVGYIDPMHNPAEPDGANLADDDPGVDDDVPTEPRDYAERVPGALAIVEHLRGYENLAYGSDLHGMFGSEEHILGLIMNTEYTYGELHDLYELNRRLDGTLEARTGPLLEDLPNRESYDDLRDLYSPLPTEPFSYGTVFDTIDYTTTGTFASWFATPEELGGLDLVAISPEMALDNRAGDTQEFFPANVELHVEGYETFVETFTEQAATTVSATVDPRGRSTAYVVSDAVARSSSDLPFAGAAAVASDDGSAKGAAFDRSDERVSTGGGGRAAAEASVPEDAHSLHVGVELESPLRAGTVTLRDGDGTAVRQTEIEGHRHRTVEWAVPSVDAGDWTVEVESDGDDEVEAVVRTGTLRLDGADASASTAAEAVDAPNPETVLGYRQREYDVTPFEFFERYRDALPEGERDRLRAVSVTDVAEGALADGDDDTVVVIHDDGFDDAAYVDALDAFVDGGGTLVVTDSGVAGLGAMSAAGTGDLDADDVERVETYVAYLGEKRDDHPLLSDVRSIQRELWKATPMGYIPGETPMHTVGTDAFEAAGGSIAATTEGGVTLGSLGGEGEGTVHVVGSLLPPANQSNLHPFGVHDYAVSFLGQTVLTNALGYLQERYVDGELVRTFGPEDSDDGEAPVPEPELTVAFDCEAGTVTLENVAAADASEVTATYRIGRAGRAEREASIADPTATGRQRDGFVAYEYDPDEDVGTMSARPPVARPSRVEAVVDRESVVRESDCGAE